MHRATPVGSEQGSISQSSTERRYRILAGEAHSWSALLLQDSEANHYLFLVADSTLEPIATEFATSLLEGREFRPWRGRQDLQPLSALPISTETSPTPTWLSQAIGHPEPTLDNQPDKSFPA